MTEQAVPPLSYSGISQFQRCPQQYYRERIVRDVVQGPPHPATAWGTEVHLALEHYLRDGVELPAHLSGFEGYARNLRAFCERVGGTLYVEHELAMTAEHQPVAFDSPQARYRGIIDYLVLAQDGSTAYIIDHKTGAVRVTQQLTLNALLCFAHWPAVQQVHAAFAWLKHGAHSRFVYRRNDAQTLDASLFAPVVKQIAIAIETGEWPCKPSGLCKFCTVRDCEYQCAP